jgi:zeaxanthin glucosyltransferase
LKVALFICPYLLGHLNPTVGLANRLIEKRWDVTYCGRIGMLTFTIKSQFKLYPLNTLPFLQSNDIKKGQSKFKTWLLNFRDNRGDERFVNRKSELEELLNKYKPDVIFLDPFYYSDFIIIKHISPNTRCIFVDPHFPSYFGNGLIPPGNSFAFPGKQSLMMWKKYFARYFLKSLWKNTIYLGKTKRNLLSKKFKELNIPPQFSIITNKLYSPAFKDVEEWFLFPKELDFPGQQLYNWQKYMPLGIDPEKFEVINSALKDFILEKESNSQAKLIYCSLGTLTDTHLSSNKRAADLGRFYQNLIDIAILKPQLCFVIKIDEKWKTALKSIPNNVYLAEFIPQMFVLKKASLMINHGGGSVNEAAYFGVPMLVLPLNSKWDAHGNAARVVFHGLGLKASLHDSGEKIDALIQKVLFDEGFTSRAKQKSEEIKRSMEEFDLDEYL